MRTQNPFQARYQVWIVDPGQWAPMHWADRPRRGILIAPAADRLFTSDEAEAFLEGFNTELLHVPKQRWGVVVPVDVCCRGPLRPGRPCRLTDSLRQPKAK